MSYSTIALIKDESGFSGNANITNPVVQGYQIAATAIIDGVLGRVYALPLNVESDLLELVERKLAAGHLLKKEYGEEAEGLSKEGKSRIDWAMDMLTQIESGKIEIRGANGVLAGKVSRIGMSGWPNNVTGTDQDDIAEPNNTKAFSRDMQF